MSLFFTIFWQPMYVATQWPIKKINLNVEDGFALRQRQEGRPCKQDRPSFVLSLKANQMDFGR